MWADRCAVLADPAVLDEAVRRAQQGWLNSDERQARRQDRHRRRAEIGRQVQRLVDAYTAEVLTLEEVRHRRATREERLEALRREEQPLLAAGVQDDQIPLIAGQVETFRARVAGGLERATCAERRALVDLLVDRVIIAAPEVEVRYVVPLTGVAERKGVLRLRHRARPPGPQAAVLPYARLRELCVSGALLSCLRGTAPVLPEPPHDGRVRPVGGAAPAVSRAVGDPGGRDPGRVTADRALGDLCYVCHRELSCSQS